LRVEHPSMDPETITRRLGISPDGSWKAGERRITPAGQLLPGIRSSSYWYSRMPTKVGLSAAELVEKTMRRLAPRKAFLRKVVATGGRWCLYITGGGNSIAEEFSFQALSLLADARGNLWLEVFRELPAGRKRSARQP